MNKYKSLYLRLMAAPSNLAHEAAQAVKTLANPPPAKVVNKSVEMNGRKVQWPSCPKCGQQVRYNYSKFCGNCGQKLTWEFYKTKTEVHS